MESKDICFAPLTADQWQDFENLFGPKGACAGCWCMFWRIPRKSWEEGKGDGNKKKMKQWISQKKFAGLIAYMGNRPVGWCSLGPREEFPVLEKSKILARIDDKPVWSIVCFFIEKEFRRMGISALFLQEVIRYAKSKGAEILEGYPVIPNKAIYPAAFAFTGFYNSFKKTGFKEIIRRSPTRPVMRYYF
jgi:GNAT superfamily N-acetyltransferase